MKSEFRNVFSDEEGHSGLGWNTSGETNGNSVSYEVVSLLEIERGRVRIFRAVSEKVVDQVSGLVARRNIPRR